MDDPGNNESCSSEQAPYCPNPSKYEIKLVRKLKELGIEWVLKYWDGEKHIDIAIPGARLYVEVDGNHPISYRQSRRDKSKDTISAIDGMVTIGVDVDDLRDETDEVADWMARIARTRS